MYVEFLQGHLRAKSIDPDFWIDFFLFSQAFNIDYRNIEHFSIICVDGIFLYQAVVFDRSGYNLYVVLSYSQSFQLRPNEKTQVNLTIGNRFLKMEIDYKEFDLEKRMPTVEYRIIPHNIDKIK
ncbi:MAG: hypothetical protein QW474_02645 [Candidatus Aenigmatarchaeota archaeon]